MHRCGEVIGRGRADLEKFLKGSVGFLLVLLAACANDPPGAGTADRPGVIERLLADRPAPATDVVEVWVCDVPLDTEADLYEGLALRQPLTPEQVIASLGERVTDYFDAVSNGAYAIGFVAGGVVPMTPTDTDATCTDAALAASSPTSGAVLAVATAEHVAGAPGGWGRPGTSLSCADDCSARSTGRAAYVGASDFHPDWGPVPLLDLVEHELGHTLGLPHSGTDTAGDDEYRSALDLMSNSAAPRDVDPGRRDAPSTLAVNLLDVGWLPADDVVIVDPARATAADPIEIELSPATGADGTRLVVLAVDEHRVLTVELRTTDGFDGHLPSAGVAVHAIDDRNGTDVLRVQLPVHSTTEPFTALLGAGAVLDVEGWRIEVQRLDATVRLAIAATDR